MLNPPTEYMEKNDISLSAATGCRSITAAGQCFQILLNSGAGRSCKIIKSGMADSFF